MQGLLKKLGTWAMRMAAALIILLALLVGVARLLLPEASRFADDVRRVAQEASGFVVDFELLSAGFSFYGPELRLTGATVAWPDGSPAFAADEIAVAIDMYELATTRKLLPALIHVEGLQLDVEVAASGQINVQGRPWSDYVQNTDRQTELTDVRVSLADIRFSFRDLKRGIDKVEADLQHMFADIDGDMVALDVEIRPDPAFGHSLELAGVLPLQLLQDPAQLQEDLSWQLQIRAEDFRLDPWLKLAAVKNPPVIGSEGTAEASLDFRGDQPVMLEAKADIDQLVLAQPDGQPAIYDSLAGTALWQAEADGWRLTGSDIRLLRDGRRWPASEFAAQYRSTSEQDAELTANVSFLRLDDLMPFLVTFAGQQLAEAGVQGIARGDIWRAEGVIELRDTQPGDYKFRADFERLGYQSDAQDIDVAGLSGEIRGDQAGGSLALATTDAHLGWGYLFREVLPVTSLESLALWRLGGDEFRLIVSELHLETPDGGGTASLELVSDKEWRAPRIDFTAEASMADATQVDRYLPNTLPAQVIEWVDKAVVAGRSDHTEFRLRGPLREFPFREDQGSFYIDIEFADAGLDYGPGWPPVENASGHLIFENESLYSSENQSTVSGIEVKNASARIADLHEPVVEIKARTPAGAGQIVSFLQDSPVAKKLGSVFADVRASGPTDVDINLQIPIRDLDNWQLQGTVVARDVSAWLTTLEPRFTKLNGELSIDRFYVTGDNISGVLMDEPVVLQIESNPSAAANFSHRASVSGRFPYSRVKSELALPDLGVIDGRSRVKAAAMFPGLGDDSEPFRLLIHSDLEGISSSLPYPLNKNGADKEDFDAELLFPEAGRVDARLTLERGLRADLDYRRTSGRWKLDGGLVRMGSVEERAPGEDALVVSASVDRLNLDEWRTAFDDADSAADDGQGGQRPAEQWQDMFESAELLVGDLQILDFSFRDTDLRADFAGSQWDVELIGPWLEGRVTVPYQLDHDARINAELARLLLIEPVDDGAAAAADEYASSPLELPGFKATVEEFALGNMRLGRLNIDVASTRNGLATRRLDLTAPSFAATISGDWQVVDTAQRSRMHLEFSSSDMQAALSQLGFAPLISARQATIVSDLLWEGGPGMAAIEASTGELSMSIRDGHINDVSSGGGRILGLLSVASLPRRLALDFADLTKDQLEFDKIHGDFSIDFGDAWTCNLGLEGEVADMALVGRTGLNVQDYNQVAVVRPHVSNLMPVPAAFLGGPTVGVAALLVSQIFKKPLSGIGESYYTVRGSWEDSQINKVQRSELDTTSFADCEQRLPTLSPEEITAIRELQNQQNAENAADPVAVPPTDNAEVVTE